MKRQHFIAFASFVKEILPCQLHCTLVGFCAGICEEYPIGKGSFSKHSCQPRLGLDVVKIGSMEDPGFNLRDQFPRIGGIAIAQNIHGDSTEEIDISVPLAIG